MQHGFFYAQIGPENVRISIIYICSKKKQEKSLKPRILFKINLITYFEKSFIKFHKEVIAIVEGSFVIYLF